MASRKKKLKRKNRARRGAERGEMWCRGTEPRLKYQKKMQAKGTKYRNGSSADG